MFSFQFPREYIWIKNITSFNFRIEIQYNSGSQKEFQTKSTIRNFLWKWRETMWHRIGEPNLRVALLPQKLCTFHDQSMHEWHLFGAIFKCFHSDQHMKTAPVKKGQPSCFSHIINWSWFLIVAHLQWPYLCLHAAHILHWLESC